MPAVVHDLDDPLPPALAADTSFLIVGLNATEERHHRARHLLDRMEREGTVVVYCSHLLLLELWSACSGLVRQRSRRELAVLISAPRAFGTTAPGWPPPTCPTTWRAATGWASRPSSAWSASSSQCSPPAASASPRACSRAPGTPSSLTRCSYDAVMLALADEAATRAGAGRHLATFDADSLAVDGLEVWGLTH